MRDFRMGYAPAAVLVERAENVSAWALTPGNDIRFVCEDDYILGEEDDFPLGVPTRLIKDRQQHYDEIAERLLRIDKPPKALKQYALRSDEPGIERMNTRNGYGVEKAPKKGVPVKELRRLGGLDARARVEVIDRQAAEIDGLNVEIGAYLSNIKHRDQQLAEAVAEIDRLGRLLAETRDRARADAEFVQKVRGGVRQDLASDMLLGNVALSGMELQQLGQLGAAEVIEHRCANLAQQMLRSLQKPPSRVQKALDECGKALGQWPAEAMLQGQCAQQASAGMQAYVTEQRRAFGPL